jgi:hypothetical protein
MFPYGMNVNDEQLMTDCQKVGNFYFQPRLLKDHDWDPGKLPRNNK